MFDKFILKFSSAESKVSPYQSELELYDHEYFFHSFRISQLTLPELLAEVMVSFSLTWLAADVCESFFDPSEELESLAKNFFQNTCHSKQMTQLTRRPNVSSGRVVS